MMDDHDGNNEPEAGMASMTIFLPLLLLLLLPRGGDATLLWRILRF